MKTRMPRKTGCRGAALMEIALCLVIFCALLFGLMELALTLFSYHTISEAAREGTRYAIVRGSACKNPDASSCTAQVSDIQTYVKNYPGINASAVTITVTCGAFGTTPVACVTSGSSANDTPGNVIQVQVSYPTSLVLPMISSRTITLTSTSQMVIYQ